MQRYQYEIIDIKYNAWKSKYDQDISLTIHQKAAEGWKLHTFNCVGTTIKLIFERPYGSMTDTGGGGYYETDELI